MTNYQVEKYRKRTRILHWIHTTAFVFLFLTGLVLFIPGLGFLAEGGITRIIHRVAAGLFVIIPIIYLTFNWRRSWHGIKKAFTWGREDIGWLKAAPAYYFRGDDSGMPPQGEMNSGQKMWWLITIVFGILFVATGAVMWFAKDAALPAFLQWMVLIHDIAFIVAGAMFFVHIYLAVFHPLMTEAWGSMVRGKISAEYARSHHGKWYDEITTDLEKDLSNK